MNKEEDYASDTDESDEDFRPDNLAGESPASEDDEAETESEALEENDNDAGERPAKSKQSTKKVIKKKKRTKNKKSNDESDDDEDTAEDETKHTSRRATRRTDEVLANGKEKTLEKNELLSDEEDKTRTNALWADFLKDVNPKASSSKANEINTAIESKSESLANKNHVLNPKIEAKDQHESVEKCKQEESKRTTITEVLDFAGEEVRVQREVDASSIKENKATTTQPVKKQPFGRIMPGAGTKRTIPSASPGVSGGIGSFLNQLGKKKKISVLEKSQMDWNSFKQTEGIDEQLQTFNKGKDG